MEKVRVHDRRQPFTRTRGATVLTVFFLCYAWFGWQLHISPLHMAAFAFVVPAIGFIAGVINFRRRTLPIAEMHETA